MKFRTLLLFSTALAIISCAKDDSSDDPSKEREITATLQEYGTRTSISPDADVVFWNKGDSIWLSDGKFSKVIDLVDYGETPGQDQGAIDDIDGYTFVCKIPNNWGKTIYGVYPASSATGFADSTFIQIEIPSIQNGDFEKANICVAITDSEMLEFKNATALLKVTQKGDSNDYFYFKSIVSDTYALTGDFTASIVNGKVTLYAGESTTNTIKGKVKPDISYYAIAPIVVSEAELKVRRSKTPLFAENIYTTKYTFSANKAYIMPLPEFEQWEYDERILIGEFSVAEGKKVQFAPGNLFVNIYNGAFHFQPSQWKENTYDNWRGHFFFSNDPKKAYADNYETETTDILFTNETAETPNPNFEVDGSKGTWRTLSGGSENEWDFLCYYRKSARKLRKANVTVCDRKGCLIIAPDGYAGQIADSYNELSWTIAESEGLVCLPTEGHRDGKTIIGAGADGSYWGSNVHEILPSRAYDLQFDISTYYDCVISDRASLRGIGQTIRLVKDI